MTILLRPYQQEALESIASNYSTGIQRQVVHLPTAAGKTVVFSSLVDQAIRKEPKTRALVLAFSCDLLTQAKDKLKMISPDLDVGIVDANHKEFGCSVVVSSVQSARQPNNLEQLKAQGFSIVIVDECHHFASDSARFVLNELGFSKIGCSTSGRLLVGFSATPFRSDSKGLGEIFDRIVYHRSIKEMIAQGYLCNPRGHRVVTDIDFAKIEVEGGDFDQSTLSRIMNTPEVSQTIVSSYQEKATGRKTIAFATSIEHSVALAQQFKHNGISSEAIHSRLSSEEQNDLKKKFRNGDIEVLVNPLLLCEGYDEPSISCVIVARPTKSSGLYQQMAGRGLRLFPGKEDCIILDFSDQNHTLCNVGILLGDNLNDEQPKRHGKSEKIEELVKDLPLNINLKLKKAIIELDLLGKSFTWQKDFNGQYFLKGSGMTVLKLVKVSEDRFDVVFHGLSGIRMIAKGLDFSYSFSAAEDFAKANRALFAVADLEASWRELPISDKQKELFYSGGFKNGIENLTRGQAAQIISSGVLKRKKPHRKSA